LIIKVLSFSEMPDWKGYDHFEREIAALKALRHPAVPRYVDSFRLDNAGNHRLCLVMERIPGRSLAAEMETGHRWTEAEIMAMFAELLSILSYLQALRPPIIHRDINPKNLIVRPDGSLALVDFSGVQDAVRLAFRDTTSMVGSAGYAPLEQLSGRATIRSDLYGAAATIATMLTRTHPSDLPRNGLSIDPGAVVDLSPGLRYILDKYLDADEARRDLPIEQAIAILRGSQAVPSNHTAVITSTADRPTGGLAASGGDGVGKLSIAGPYNMDDDNPINRALGRLAGLVIDRLESSIDTNADQHGDDEDILALPRDSKVKLLVDRDSLSLNIPRRGMLSSSFLGGGIFTSIWLGFIAFWTFMAIAMGAPLFFPAFSLPFWAVGIMLFRTLLKPGLTKLQLDMTRTEGVILTETFLRRKVQHWPIEDIGTCAVKPTLVTQRGHAEQELVLELGTRTIRFGRNLSRREQISIASNINAWRKGTKLPTTPA
jgi:serine/threonine protein kinase